MKVLDVDTRNHLMSKLGGKIDFSTKSHDLNDKDSEYFI